MDGTVSRLAPPLKAPSSRAKLLDAALLALRERGYNATTVDDLCAVAGVTKGAFFHHFKSKEDLAIAAADYWSAITSEMFAQASYHQRADPLDRMLGYIDLRAELIRGAPAQFTCVVGTMTQEIFQTNPRIREACFASISGHAEQLEDDIAEAIDLYHVDIGFTAKSLALHTQAVLQGAFILAKAKDDPQAATDSIAHLRRYFELLFDQKSRG
jgi:TetR/AcrR family transcriptional regulator, transcriptional repressor for nem operon